MQTDLSLLVNTGELLCSGFQVYKKLLGLVFVGFVFIFVKKNIYKGK